MLLKLQSHTFTSRALMELCISHSICFQASWFTCFIPTRDETRPQGRSIANRELSSNLPLAENETVSKLKEGAGADLESSQLSALLPLPCPFLRGSVWALHGWLPSLRD